MNKKYLIQEVAEATNMSKVDTTKVIDSFLESIEKCLVKDEKVALAGFGIFSVTARKARMGVNPKTGERIQIAASNAVKFKSSKNLKELVNK